MKNNTFEEIWKEMKKGEKILLSLHPKPDGDSLGSCTALKRILEKEGKKVSLFSKDDLSENLAELDISKEIKFGVDISEIEWNEFDLVILLDHGGLQYYSRNIKEKFKGKKIINIDHHETNELYGNLNYLDKDAPSTCSILIQFFKNIKIDFDKELARRLFIGLATDTGFFTYTNANKGLKDAGFLIEKGVDYINEVYKPILGSTSLKVKRLHGVLLKNLEVINIGNAKIAFSFISKEDIKKNDLRISDLRLGIDVIRNIKGVDFEFTLSELEGEIKGSFRSPGTDVSKFAEELGGGGHKLAAAFVLKGTSLEEAKEKVFQAIKKKGISSI